MNELIQLSEGSGEHWFDARERVREHDWDGEKKGQAQRAGHAAFDNDELWEWLNCDM